MAGNRVDACVCGRWCRTGSHRTGAQASQGSEVAGTHHALEHPAAAMPQGLERRPPPTRMVVARHITPDREPPPPTHTVALPIMRQALERRLSPTRMVVARHTTRELVPSLQIHMARRHTIHPPPWRTTEQAATTAAPVQLQVPEPRAL